MGASSFVVSGKGESERDVFLELCREAVRIYGSSPYNGTISTTDLGDTVSFIGNYSPVKDKKIVYNFLRNVFNGNCSKEYAAEKYVAKCIKLIYVDGTKEFVFYGLAAT